MSDTSHNLTHIAFILDGNRRWAKKQNVATLEGHLAGYKNLKTIAQACWDAGIHYFTCYLFSTENWNRDKSEVSYLMNLALKVILKDAKELHQKNVRLRIIGSREHLSDKLKATIAKAEALTEGNTAGTMLACFNYGGQEELVTAFKKMVHSKVREADISVQSIKDNLYTHGVPAPDLIVRTSGERRLSNFLLWDSAYAELAFTNTLWPDFNETELHSVIDDYNARNRRYGK